VVALQMGASWRAQQPLQPCAQQSCQSALFADMGVTDSASRGCLTPHHPHPCIVMFASQVAASWQVQQPSQQCAQQSKQHSSRCSTVTVHSPPSWALWCVPSAGAGVTCCWRCALGTALALCGGRRRGLWRRRHTCRLCMAFTGECRGGFGRKKSRGGGGSSGSGPVCCARKSAGLPRSVCAFAQGLSKFFCVCSNVIELDQCKLMDQAETRMSALCTSCCHC
jgi:hypothetical protein